MVGRKNNMVETELPYIACRELQERDIRWERVIETKR